ncbi:MAG: type IV pilus modification PilV family protein [Actinomycetota bacterium]
MLIQKPIRFRSARTAGFSLLELTIASSILAVGLLAGMGVICAAVASNGSSKINTAAAIVAQSTMEKILAVPQGAAGAAALTSLTDCAGNSLVMSTAPGGSPVTTGLFPGIDYIQPAVVNYSMIYATCSGLQFDVRWSIQAGQITPSTELVTVSVKSLRTPANPAAALVRKFSLQMLRGN